MFGYKCEDCGKGIVRTETKKDYVVKVEGDDFKVPEAIIGVCDKCGAINYSGKEVERWKKEYQDWKRSAYVNPKTIKKIRDKLNLNQGDFADLIGVSRQSLIEWEKEDRKRTQPNSINILLKSIKRELDGKLGSFIEYLVRQYQERMRKEISIDLPTKRKSKESQVRALFPVSTCKILSNRADENNTDMYTEAVRLMEVSAYQALLYSEGGGHNLMDTSLVLSDTYLAYNSVENDEVSKKKGSKKITEQSYSNYGN